MSWSRRVLGHVCASMFLLALLIVGCRSAPPSAAPLNESTRDVSEAFSRYREATRENDIARAWRLLSAPAKKRYSLWEYAVLMDSDTVLGRLLRQLLTAWDVVALACGQDRKIGWIILRHPRSPQLRKSLVLVSEYDTKLNQSVWRIDLRLSELMLLPTSLEGRLPQR